MSELWEAEARRYDAGYDSTGRAGRVIRARQEAAIGLLGDGLGIARVLDVGMGGGRLCTALADNGWEVAGVDPSEAMVALARSRLPGAAETLVVGRAEELPFPDASFDAVTALGSLEYTRDLDAALREIARVMPVKGRAVLSWPNYGGLTPLWRGRVLYPSLRAIKRILPVGRPVPPPASLPLPLDKFLEACGDARLFMAIAAYIYPSGRVHWGDADGFVIRADGRVRRGRNPAARFSQILCTAVRV
jgi:SAM-dependent methyltransferase